MSGNRQKAQATTKALAAEKAKAAAAKRSALSAMEDAAAEVAAAEGAIEKEAEVRSAPPPKAARPAAPAKPAPAPPPEPIPRLKDLQQTKEKEGYQLLQEAVQKLSDQLQKVKRSFSLQKGKETIEERAKGKGWTTRVSRRASQEQKPTKTNAQRRTEKVCVEINHKNRNIIRRSPETRLNKSGWISADHNTTRIIFYVHIICELIFLR
jgi:predicted RNA-binding protein